MRQEEEGRNNIRKQDLKGRGIFMVQTPTKPTTPMDFTKKELIELRHRFPYQSPTPMDSNELQ